MKLAICFFFILYFIKCLEPSVINITANKIYKNQSFSQENNYTNIYKLPIRNLKKNQWFKIFTHYLGPVN